MLINDFTGYMLGGVEQIFVHGDQWYPTDSEVCVYLTKERACEILDNLQKHNTSLNHVLTTVYRVKAKRLHCARIKNGLVYVSNPSQIFVDAPVCYKNPNRPGNVFTRLANYKTKGKQK